MPMSEVSAHYSTVDRGVNAAAIQHELRCLALPGISSPGCTCLQEAITVTFGEA